MSSRKNGVPYWLGGGTETCHGCTHIYHYEIGWHCVGCDRGVCANCAVVERATHDVWCRECLAEREEE